MIVVGFDGAPAGEDALSLGRLMSELTGDPITAVVVTPTDHAAVTRHGDPRFGRLATDAAEVERRARELLEQSGAQFEVRVVSARSPARGLDEVVHSLPTSVVVIGSTGRGPVGRVFAGTTGERLLQGSPAAVAVAPEGYRNRRTPRPSTIAVAYLSKQDSQRALVVGADLAKRHSMRLRVVTVVPPPEEGRPLASIHASHMFNEQRREAFQRELENALAGVHSDVDVSGEVLESTEAGQALAALTDVDLLVCASRGYGPVRRVLLGGVSAALVRGAACPVLIVPRGDH
ncbi:MAG: universal stress protein [Actinomycetes bacterium]